MDSFIIGDVHGHFDRLEKLLESVEIVKNGQRVNHDIETISLGDLGHFGKTGSPTGDRLCYEKVGDWIDLVLWGNHDRAVADWQHTFNGFEMPGLVTKTIMENLVNDAMIKYAIQRHGYLITHAGLHRAFGKDQLLSDLIEKINYDPQSHIINNIPHKRGGYDRYGGILWRDYSEPLSKRWPQIYGHTMLDEVTKDGDSYCIDIGSKDNGRLAGIWLPSKEIVEVKV